MNDRLRNLMTESGYAAPEMAGRARKLAELIILECAKEAYRVEITVEEGLMYANRMLAHFGLEEM